MPKFGVLMPVFSVYEIEPRLAKVRCYSTRCFFFSFMWQMVSYIPTTLSQRSEEDITLLSAKLATSFFLDSFIHAKEKLNIVQWVESLTKQVTKSWLLATFTIQSTVGI